jgi:protein-L-isoaspartate(D-aspartate) O-methyltransferase
MQDTRIAELAAASAARRRTMVDCQVRTFEVTDPAILARMVELPRELFLPPELAPFAYSDAALEIRPGDCADAHRVLPAPLVLARMLQCAGIGATDKVLDVGSAGGYAAALLAGLCGEVVSLETDRRLCDFTRARLAGFGLTNVAAVCGPLEKGVPGKAPFDVIVINGAVEAGLERLLAQLRIGGRLVALSRSENDPMGRAGRAVLYQRVDGAASSRFLFDARAPVLEGFRKAPEFTFA